MSGRAVLNEETASAGRRLLAMLKQAGELHGQGVLTADEHEQLRGALHPALRRLDEPAPSSTPPQDEIFDAVAVVADPDGEDVLDAVELSPDIENGEILDALEVEGDADDAEVLDAVEWEGTWAPEEIVDAVDLGEVDDGDALDAEVLEEFEPAVLETHGDALRIRGRGSEEAPAGLDLLPLLGPEERAEETSESFADLIELARADDSADDLGDKFSPAGE